MYDDPAISATFAVIDQLRKVEWRIAGSPEGPETERYLTPMVVQMRQAAAAKTPTSKTKVHPLQKARDVRAELARRQQAGASTSEPAPANPTRRSGAHKERAAWIRDELAARRAANQ